MRVTAAAAGPGAAHRDALGGAGPARTVRATAAMGSGVRGKGDELGWGLTHIIDKAPTYYTKVATEAY